MKRLYQTGLITLCLAVAGCGGGGSTATEEAGSPVVATTFSTVQQALQGVALGMGATSGSGGGGFGRPVIGSQNSHQKGTLAGIYRTLQSPGFGSSDSHGESDGCLDGGTMDMTETATGFSVVFDECINIVEGMMTFQDGQMSFEETDTTFNFFNNMVTRLTNVETGAILSESVTEEMTFSGNLVGDDACGPDSISMVMNGSMVIQSDFNFDGTPDAHLATVFTDYNLAMAASNFDGECSPQNFQASQWGGFAFTDHIDTENSMGMDISVEEPLLLIVEVEADEFCPTCGGETWSISGSYSAESSCFTGSLTVATLTPVFIPDSSEDQCPIAGEIQVTGDLNATIAFQGNGSVTVDQGNDGTVDETYEDCNEAGICEEGADSPFGWVF